MVYMAIFVGVGLWILEFVTALYQFSIAYAVAKFYYTKADGSGDRNVGPLPVLEGVRAGVVFHLGSLALGSSIITVLEVFQKLLQYADMKSKEENNACVSCILDSLMCCFVCLRGTLQYISKNAYIDMAISSSGFCAAVRNVGHVMIDHGASMAVLNGATFIFQVVGMIMITLVSGVAAWLLLGTGTFSDEGAPFYVPNMYMAVSLACVLALIVAWAFMAVFDMATDTLLFCIALDMNKHGAALNADSAMKALFDQAGQKAARDKILDNKAREKANRQAARAAPVSR